MSELPTTDRQLHTPGPWTLQELDGDEVYMIGLPQKVGFKVVAEVTFGYDEPWDTQQHANARLIAAAPDLLEALKRLTRAYVSTMESGRDRIVALGGDCDPVDVMERGDPYLGLAKDAIAKAEGRS